MLESCGSAPCRSLGRVALPRQLLRARAAGIRGDVPAACESLWKLNPITVLQNAMECTTDYVSAGMQDILGSTESQAL